MKSLHSALKVQREWQLFACHHHNIALNSSTVINLYVATINTAIANCDTEKKKKRKKRMHACMHACMETRKIL